MIKKAIYFISGIMVMSVLISLTDKMDEPKIPVSKTRAEWQAIIFVMSNPDDVTANQKKEIISSLVNDINKQIAVQDSILKQKVISDSINNSKQKKN